MPDMQVIINVIYLAHLAACYRILIYSPRMMQSHVNYVAEMANVLARNGHNVTVIDNVFRYDISNSLSDDVQQILTVEPSPDVTNMLETNILPDVLWKSTTQPSDQKMLMEGLGNIHKVQCVHMLNNTNIIETLKGMPKFDFVIHEVFDVCGLGIVDALGLKKSVIVSSTVIMDAVNQYLGITHPLKYISILSDYGNKLPLLEARRSLQFQDGMINFFEIQRKPMEDVMRTKYSINRPSTEVMRETNLLYMNSHHLCDGQRDWTRQMFEIGGIAFRKPKPLNKKYQEFLKDKKNVVLISFGTAAPSFKMPAPMKKAMIEAITSLPDVFFIWKYEKDDEFSRQNISNVVFRKFMPQIDLLNSGRVSLFISHGGQNSLLESFQSGVSTIFVPLFGDQHRNAAMVTDMGLAAFLQKTDLRDSKKIVAAIKSRLNLSKNERQKLDMISDNMKMSKKNAEELLVLTINQTFAVENPPNFVDSAHFYHPMEIVHMIDVGLAICAFAGMFIAWLMMRNKFSITIRENDKIASIKKAQ